VRGSDRVTAGTVAVLALLGLLVVVGILAANPDQPPARCPDPRFTDERQRDGGDMLRALPGIVLPGQ
jgi:hypothetical protein